MKNDVKRVVSLHKKVCGIDGCLGCLDVTKIHWSHVPLRERVNLRVKRVIQQLVWKWLQITTYGYGIMHLAFLDLSMTSISGIGCHCLNLC